MKLSNNKKSIIKTIIFVIIFLLLYALVNNIFKGKGYAIDEFLLLKRNSRDVIFIGSSHVYTTILPAIIWEESGVTSFNLTGSALPFWTQYHYIKETIKTQTPKVIVCELYGVVSDTEYLSGSFIFQHLSTMKASKNKIDAIFASVPKNLRIDYLLEFPLYHGRRNISINDFRHLLGLKTPESVYLYFNGYFPHYGYAKKENKKQKKPNVSTFLGYGEIPGKQLKYLMKIIELAKEQRDIKFLFLITPYRVSEKDELIFNSIEKIARENGIEFINYNFLYDEIGLDFNTDLFDETHLNEKGAMKLSKDLAKRLSLYELKDNRNNPDYEFWNIRSAEALQKIKNDSAAFYEANKE
ncbi:MAG: SGNH/GDSL hydrolase family protein [Elusimicrobiota bacterium]|jgi:hypothetical protein|nr:SGNH/GDSL hydrolase family protein [Elusimicrobiota bacterium]